MSTELYEVDVIKKGTLFIMPKPSYFNIDRDMKYYKSKGVDKIISLLEYDEADSNGMTNEKEDCENVGIVFEQYPIKDGGIPEIGSFIDLVISSYNEIKKGKNIAVHCFGGIGRSGMLSCAIIMLKGYSTDEAVELVSKKREYPVPETGEQYNFLKMLKFG